MMLVKLMEFQCNGYAPVDLSVQTTVQPVNQLSSLVEERAKSNVVIGTPLPKIIDRQRYGVEDQSILKRLNWRQWMLQSSEPWFVEHSSFLQYGWRTSTLHHFYEVLQFQQTREGWAPS